VRNVIVSHRNVRGAAQELAQSASFRSFERRSALFFRVFAGAEFVNVDGEPAAIFRFDLPRFTRVMEAIAYALFYKENERQRYAGQWNVFSPTLLGANDFAGIPDDWEAFRDLMSRIPFAPQAAPEPTVFRYEVHNFDDGVHFAYALEFYGGFQTYVWTQ